MKLQNIAMQVYYDLRIEKSKSKIAAKCWNILDEDRCMIVLMDNEYWYIEKTSQYNSIPKYFRDFLKRFIQKKYGFEYLYDKFPLYPFPNEEV